MKLTVKVGLFFFFTMLKNNGHENSLDFEKPIISCFISLRIKYRNISVSKDRVPLFCKLEDHTIFRYDLYPHIKFHIRIRIIRIRIFLLPIKGPQGANNLIQ